MLLTALGRVTYAWGSAEIIIMGVIGVLSIIGFARIEQNATEPILPPGLFRNRVFVVTSVLGFVVGFALSSSLTYLPPFQQVVRGLDPTESGLQMLPLMAGSSTSFALTRRSRQLNEIDQILSFPGQVRSLVQMISILNPIHHILPFGRPSRLPATSACPSESPAPALGRLAAAAAMLVFAWLVVSPPTVDAHPSPKPVISQVYGGGGNASAPYLNDFIEVFDQSGSTVDLTGYSVQYAPATSGTWSVTPLTGSLAIGQHLLVAEASSGGAGAALPTPDAIGSTDLSAVSGKVALVSSFVPLTGTCPTGSQILDLVGYGSSANCFEGSGPTSNASNTTSATRKTSGCTDTNNNSADFQILAPSPRNTSSAGTPCAPIPSTPTLSSSDPASPGNSITPKILGSAGAGTTVELYTDDKCAGSPVATGTAAQFSSSGITATMSADSTTTFRALAFDANNSSACSSSFLTYVEDSTPPASPTLHASAPASPAANTSPKLLGTAEAASTVKLYTDSACTSLVATGTAAAFDSPGISVTVAPDSTTTFHATATDQAGNTSACSSSSLTYTEDSTPPAQPTLDSSNPASPAANTSPKLLGTAEAASTVKLYTDSACTNLAATGSAAQFASPGITVTVAPDSTTTFHATATDQVGNTSPCSANSLTYIEDPSTPTEPAFTSSTPASPANDTSPKLAGSSDPGSTVRIYTDSACTNLAATGSAAQFNSPGIPVSVARNSTTTFHATARNAAGNTSACSSSSLTYTEDSTPPAQPTLDSSNPASPASNTSPKLLGTAEAASTVRLYTNSACTSLVATGTAAAFDSPGISVTVAPDSTTTFHATATDQAGNTSACSSSSLTFVEDPPLPRPVVADLGLTPKNFAIDQRRTPVAGVARQSPPRGTNFRFTLSTKASVSFTILRQPRRLQAPGPLGSPVHTFRRSLAAGRNLVPFSGRLANRVFPPAKYRVYVIATNANGKRSRRVSVPFRILAR